MAIILIYTYQKSTCVLFLFLNKIIILFQWVNDPHRMDKRLLSLIFLAHASDVLENAFAPLNDDDYDLGMKHVRFLLDSDLEVEAGRQNANEVMWAVFAAFIK